MRAAGCRIFYGVTAQVCRRGYTLCRQRLISGLMKVGFVVDDVKLEEIVLVICSLLVCLL
jgi:hypothetical protein